MPVCQEPDSLASDMHMRISPACKHTPGVFLTHDSHDPLAATDLTSTMLDASISWQWQTHG